MSNLTKQKIADLINNQTHFSSKLDIYTAYYSLLKADGKLSADGYGSSQNVFYCEYCKCQDLRFMKYDVEYAQYRENTIKNLDDYLQSEAPYGDKLDKWIFHFNDSESKSFVLSGTAYILELNPVTPEEIKQHNSFFLDFYKNMFFEGPGLEDAGSWAEMSVKSRVQRFVVSPNMHNRAFEILGEEYKVIVKSLKGHPVAVLAEPLFREMMNIGEPDLSTWKWDDLTCKAYVLALQGWHYMRYLEKCLILLTKIMRYVK